MTKLLADPRKEADKKRNKAIVAWAGTAAVGALTASPLLIGIGVGVAGLFTFKWLKHRGEWGLKF